MRHRFSLPLYFAVLALFIVVFGGELLVDLGTAAARSGRSAGELWPELSASWIGAAQAGGCLARAGYSMLVICLSLFFLSIPAASTFYTPKLTELYLRDRVNQVVFAAGVLAAAITHFQTSITWPGFAPVVSLWIGVAAVAAAWAVLLPYAFYAIRFLTPDVLLERLERALVEDVDRAARQPRTRTAAALRQGILDLAALPLRAIDRSDRDLTLDGVHTLARGYLAYLRRKRALPAAWFAPPRQWFAGLSDEAFALIVRERIWVGHLFLHQVWLIYAATLVRMPDAAAEVAAVALGVATAAAEHRDAPLLALGLRLGNTMLREAVKRGEVGVVAEVARIQNEMIAEVARLGGEDTAAEERRHLSYYAGLARAAGDHEVEQALRDAMVGPCPSPSSSTSPPAAAPS